MDSTSVGWPRTTSRKIGAGVMTISRGMLDAVCPNRHDRDLISFGPVGFLNVERRRPGLARAGEIALGLAGTGCGAVDGGPGSPLPTSTSRTLAIAGSAHPQSVMALPARDRMTQLISTAPPLISTHAVSRHVRSRKGTAASCRSAGSGVGSLPSPTRESSVGIRAGHVKLLPPTQGGHR